MFALAAALTVETAPRSAGLRPGALERVPNAGPETGAPSLNPQPSTLNPPAVLHYFGDYELIEEIARGGMGVVYRARQVSLNRTVAVKVLLFGQFASDEFVQRFRTEAEAAGNLHHPNIVAIHEIGDHDGRQYFSMDYVEGGHLGDLARTQPLTARRIAALLKTIAEAVHHAHQRGVLHRDLKPSNVLIDPDGQPRLTDFGLAKRVESQSELKVEGGASPAATPPLNPQLKHLSTDLTLTGQMLGTPNYASPEQAGGRRGAITTASDVYSLGAILYFLLTGRPPFLGDSLEQTLDRVLHDEPVPPRLLNPSVPRDLETICLKCLNKEPSARYVSAQALADDLGRFLNDEPIHARPAGRAEKLWRWCRRKPALAALVVALHLVGAAGLGGILWQWGRAEQHARRESAQRLRAEEAVTHLELQLAEDLLEKDETVRGVAHLARIVRQQPDNHVAATRLVSALTLRDFVLPAGSPLRHGQKVNYAEFSPDGRQVATASLDNSARVWDARTGQPLTPPLLHLGAVRYAHFSPDGQRLVTVSDESKAQLWEAATGRKIGQPLQHERQVRFAQFSPDGRRVVTASDDRMARFWDAHTGEPVLAPLLHAAAVLKASFSLDGQWVVTISDDATARVWNAQSGQPAGQPLAHSGKIRAAQFSPDSRWVVTASDDGTARVSDASTGEVLTRFLRHKDRVRWVEFSPDGQRIATASDDGTAQIWDTRSGEPLVAPLQHGGSVVFARFSPDGQRLITGFHDNTVRMWNARTGRLLAVPAQHDQTIWSARFSPDGQFVVTATSDKSARIWDVRAGRAPNISFAHADRVHYVAISPDDEWIATASWDKTARIWSTRTGRPRVSALPHQGRVSPVQFSPDGERVVTASDDGTARLWNARTGQAVTGPIEHDGRVSHAEFSPDGKWFLTGSRNKAIRLWNARTGQFQSELIRHPQLSPVAHFSPDSRTVVVIPTGNDIARVVEIDTGNTLVELRGHGAFLSDAVFSPDSGRVVTASDDATARVWDSRTGEMLAPPLSHKAFVRHARFSPDGRWILTTSDDGTARIWDSRTGQAVTEPMRHRGRVGFGLFSPDGRRIVTASVDGTARLWDTRTGRPLAEPFQHAGDVNFVDFSPDGRRVATASFDSTARLWELPPTIPTRSRREEAHSLRTINQSLVTSAATIQSEDSPAHAIILADLAEAVIGQRLGDGGTLEPVSSHRLVELRQRISSVSSTNDFTGWLAWFLADRSTRTISPNSPITIPEYIERRLEERSLAAAREAVLLAPTNAVALAHLAEMLLTSPGAKAPVAMAEAQFLIRRAKAFAPGDARVRESHQRVDHVIERQSR